MIALSVFYPTFCGFNIQFASQIQTFNTVLSQIVATKINRQTCLRGEGLIRERGLIVLQYYDCLSFFILF